MKRSAIKRGKPLAHGTTRLKARKTPKAFRKRRDPAYQAWVRQLGCLISGLRCWYDVGQGPVTAYHKCWHGVQVCHVKSRGAGGDDRGNVVPLCAGAHEEQHRIGIKSWQKRWGIDLKAEAARLYATYLTESGNHVD